jgi:hypothetical protein
MYSMFLTFFLITIWFFVLGYFYERKPFKIWAFLAGLITISLHSSGILILAIWGIPLIWKSNQVRSKTSLLVLMAALGIFFYGYRELSTLKIPVAMKPDAGFVNSSSTYSDGIVGLMQWFTDLLYLKVMPSASLLSHIIEHHAYIFCLLTTGVMFATAYSWLNYGRRANDSSRLFFMAVILLSLAVFNFFSLILMVAITLSIWHRDAVRKWLQIKFTRYAMALLLSIFLFWTWYGLFVWKGVNLGSLSGFELARKTLKDGLSFPALHIIMLHWELVMGAF